MVVTFTLCAGKQGICQWCCIAVSVSGVSFLYLSYRLFVLDYRSYSTVFGKQLCHCYSCGVLSMKFHVHDNKAPSSDNTQ